MWVHKIFIHCTGTTSTFIVFTCWSPPPIAGPKQNPPAIASCTQPYTDMKQCAMKEVNKTLSTTSLLVNTYDIRALTQYTQWETCQGNTQIAAMTFDLESNGEMNNYFSSMLVKSLSLHMTSMQTYVSSVHRKTKRPEKCKTLWVCVFSHTHFRYDELEYLDFYLDDIAHNWLHFIRKLNCIPMYLCM